MFHKLNEEAYNRGYQQQINFSVTIEGIKSYMKMMKPSDELLSTYSYYFDTNGYIILEKIEKLDSEKQRVIFTKSFTKSYLPAKL